MNEKHKLHGNDGKQGNDEIHKSHSSHQENPNRPIIPPRGDYQTLLSYQQLETLEKEFIEQGGLRERMTKARLNYRNQRPKESC